MSKHTPIIERPHPAKMGEVQKIYRFENGYGASVVRFSFSYGGDRGLWELAVVKFDPANQDAWHLDYTTPITSNVIGYQSDEEIAELLDQISALPTGGDQ